MNIRFLATQFLQCAFFGQTIRQFTFVALATLISAFAVAAEFTGTIPGEFSVSQNGAAIYRVPIDVPTGTGGMKPNIALVHSSQGGTGVAGQHWEITGISRIYRCPRTIAQDGVVRGVEYDLQDRFCMDGQRLVLISGTYGVYGSDYRTEIESFRKIVAYGTAGNGPAYFKATDPSGMRHTYSQGFGVHSGTTGIWARSATLDRFGNIMSYEYVNSPPSVGEFLIDRIEYTQNQGLDPKYAV
jgi:hypothetical protein